MVILPLKKEKGEKTVLEKGKRPKMRKRQGLAACRVGSQGDRTEPTLTALPPCDRSHNPNDYQIRLGYTKLSSPTRYSREMSVYKLIVHKDYDKYYRQGSDIVLMQLESPVEYSSHILPACVPDKNVKLPNEKACWASGWGHTREDGEYTGQVKRVRGKRLWRSFLWLETSVSGSKANF